MRNAFMSLPGRGIESARTAEAIDSKQSMDVRIIRREGRGRLNPLQKGSDAFLGRFLRTARSDAPARDI
jgi:hypothetical protein